GGGGARLSNARSFSLCQAIGGVQGRGRGCPEGGFQGREVVVARRRLTKRQRDRVAQIQARRRAKVASAPGVGDEAGLRPEQQGLVIANFGAALVVEDDAGALYHCALRQNLGLAVCGDRVVFQVDGTGGGVVVAIADRHSALARLDAQGFPKPMAANVDQLVVVVAPVPELDEFLVDRYVVASAELAATTLLVVNKVDLLTAEARAALEGRLEVYRAIECPVLWLSAQAVAGMDALAAALQHRTSILVGQSGVGKSSLVNALLPNREVRVQAVSAATGRGTHTTTTATLYHLPAGGDLIDSPGVRSARGFELGPLTPEGLNRGFPDLQAFAGHCRFANCSHRQEPDCAVQGAMARGAVDPRRLASYHHLKDLLQQRDEAHRGEDYS
ncbi:MAG: ribosome small subunit-dependent GTPase A, partial [Candidatus Competibacterales bacterium]